MGCMVPRGFDNHLGSDVQPRLPLNWTMARQARNGLDNLFLHELHNAPIMLQSCTNQSYSNHVQTLDPNRNPTPTAQVRGPQPGKGWINETMQDVSILQVPTDTWSIDTSCLVETPPQTQNSGRTHARLQPHTRLNPNQP
jgi:hypothetical protein